MVQSEPGGMFFGTTVVYGVSVHVFLTGELLAGSTYVQHEDGSSSNNLGG